MESVPEDFHDLFKRKAYASFATLLPDSTPHVTPVWIDYDGEHILVNTAKGRQKEVNVRRRPEVGVLVLDPEDPYRYVSVQGRVAEITQEGAVEHIDELTQRYMGVDEYPNKGEEMGPRVIIKVRPEKVITSG